MTKTKFVSAKYLPLKPPFGLTALAYLLYEQIKPTGTSKGVVLTILIGYVSFVWIMCIVQLFVTEGCKPVFEDKKV